MVLPLYMISHQIVCGYPKKKSFFQLEEDIYVCFIYVPPVNSTFPILKKTTHLSCLKMMFANLNLT